MKKGHSRRVAFYFAEDMIKEVRKEAKRQQRTQAWLLITAYRMARSQIQAMRPRPWDDD